MFRLQDFGSFYLGGRKIILKDQPPQKLWRCRGMPKIDIDINGEYLIEQGYVQYFIPEDHRYLPIILIHGGGHTGAVWENTPDGRTGWLHYFVQHQRPVYVLDNVERGRAGWCSIPGVWSEAPDLRSDKRIIQDFRLFADNNQQFPLADFHNLLKCNVPKWNIHPQESSAMIAELANKIGPCWLIAHSQGCEFAFDAVKIVPEKIHGAIFLEPTTCPSPDKNYRNKYFAYIFGDFIEKSDFWQQLYKNAKRQAEELQDEGAKVDWIHLPEINIHGNSHLFMMDRNSDEVATFINKLLLQGEHNLGQKSRDK